ncbi:MAG TPA: Rne/Rng family ribonuclease [Thermoanaerobaculia bacterium]|jgi:ribonuclease G
MSAKMLVETDPYEIRIGILEDDRLAELHLERRSHRGTVGNVYLARVTRVLPGMQAAFLDIGLDRDAFLYVADVVPEVPAEEELDLLGGDGANGGTEAERTEADAEPRAAPAPLPTIDTLLRPGQTLLVQVSKDPLPNKGARVTTHVTLPGRFLVLLPTVGHLGVSRRIEDDEERARLRRLLDALPGEGGGLIVRTAGEGRDADDFAADRQYLVGLWQRIREAAERSSAPALVHQDRDLALRVVRDRLSEEFAGLWVDDEETYARIVEFLDHIQPQLVPRVRLDRAERGLFERFGIETEIEAALKPKVWLKSGGHLVINQTEALVAIDVNTGRYVGERDLETTALATNLEAVEEVVRQIRLRDLGGIIVLDLIDMVEAANRERVFEALGRELKKDRSKHKVLSISEFGLVEITRKRSRTNLERQLTRSCPCCEGSGRVSTAATTCLRIRRALLRMRGGIHWKDILLRVHPDVAKAFQREERAVLEELESALGAAIHLQGDAKLHPASFDILEM